MYGIALIAAAQYPLKRWIVRASFEIDHGVSSRTNAPPLGKGDPPLGATCHRPRGWHPRRGNEDEAMRFLHILLDVFLFPGNLMLRKCGISIEEDGGLFRSFVNMCVWGAASLAVAMYIFL
ncbi:MAG TPA: hypothetical protein ENH89_13750 [Aurantimonas coralicida]|uniref:Uncharacterized protein n=2 Tax=root TaxID=1 RepID=A0A9C9THJ3_9HYPH|nr:hypothetical protein [Aurantimonas coralicida]